MRKKYVLVGNEALHRYMGIPIRVDDPHDVSLPGEEARVLLSNIILEQPEFRGPVLDLGTGSGVVAIGLFKLGCKDITAADINSRALEIARRNFEADLRPAPWNECVNFVTSDFFDDLVLTYQLIVVVPPTLPDIEEVRVGKRIDYALLAGPDGREFIDDLIEEFPTHLDPNGRMVLAHPSYCNLDKTRAALAKKGFRCRVLAEEEQPLVFHPDIYEEDRQVAILTRLRELMRDDEGYWYDSQRGTYQLHIVEVRRGHGMEPSLEEAPTETVAEALVPEALEESAPAPVEAPAEAEPGPTPRPRKLGWLWLPVVATLAFLGVCLAEMRGDTPEGIVSRFIGYLEADEPDQAFDLWDFDQPLAPDGYSWSRGRRREQKKWTDLVGQWLQTQVQPALRRATQEGDDATVAVRWDQGGGSEDTGSEGAVEETGLRVRRVDGEWKIIGLDR